MPNRRSLTIDTSRRPTISQIDALITPTSSLAEGEDKEMPNTENENIAVFNTETEDKAASNEENQVNPIVTAVRDESNPASFGPDEHKPTDGNEEEAKEEKETDTSSPRTCRFSFLPRSPLVTSDEAIENYPTQAP